MRIIPLGLYLLFACFQSIAQSDIVNTYNTIKTDSNALYAFFKDMPKGGELHFHLAGSAYPEVMLEVAAQNNYCLNPKTFTMAHSTQDCTGIKSGALATHPTLYAQTIRAWSLKDFVPGKESAHDHFFAAFYKFLFLVNDHPSPLLADVMKRAANQQELYMEIMVLPDNAKSTMFAPQSVNPENFDVLRKQLLANPAFMTEIDNAVAKSNAYLPDTRQFLGCEQQPNQPVCHLTVRFQYYILREQPIENVFAQAVLAFELASRSPAIVGVNLVQAEDGIISLRDYRKQMAIINYMHSVYPDVHIALHAGELSMGDVLPENLRFHIHDAIHTGHAERIGHGIDIAHEDNAKQLVNYMATKPVPVEINLTSNQKILKIWGKQCALNYYLAHHVPVVLSTDDEGILRTDLTSQYVEAAMLYNLDYPTIKQINRNALTYSFLPGKSLWENAGQGKMISVCKDLQSPSCSAFVKTNEKARLQRLLELKLVAFEKTL